MCLCEAQPGASFSIAGSFNEWSSEVMTWDGTCFVYVVRIGAGGSESFHVLADGSCEAAPCPTAPFRRWRPSWLGMGQKANHQDMGRIF